MLNVPAGLAFVLSAVSVFCAMRFPPCMKKPDKERSDNEVLTTDIRKPFFFIGRYYLFTVSFFFLILVVMVVREGKVPQYQGFREFCPTTRPTTGSTTKRQRAVIFAPATPPEVHAVPFPLWGLSQNRPCCCQARCHF